MKHPIQLVITIISTLFVNAIHAGDPALVNSNISLVLNTDAIQISCSAGPDIGIKSNDKKSAGLNKAGIITGTALIFCGAALSYAGQKLGNEYYARYKKSAFTENTDILRRNVIGCNVLRIGGAVIAGTGLVVFVFSF